MRTLFPTTLLLLFSVAFCPKVAAQTQSFEELHKRMLDMQLQMMEQLKNSPFHNFNFAMPQSDTTFFFQFDTTFEGGGMSQFFHFSPFGTDSTMRGDFLGFDRFFDQFFNSETPFKQPDYGIYDFPRDDGEQPATDDELLPEERLRRQEELEKSKKANPMPKTAEPKPDPKVKTIRI